MNSSFNQPDDQTVRLPQPEGRGAAGQLLPVPDDSLQALLDFSLERGYLEALSSREMRFPKSPASLRAMAWVAMERLPVHPTHLEDYTLLPRWQSVLSTLHSWGHRLLFLLLRSGGKTQLFLGAVSKTGLIDAPSAAAQLCQATSSQMPGIELAPVENEHVLDRIVLPLTGLRAAGAVTGLPSPRKADDYGLLQTLDQLAFGIRDFSHDEHDYALIVIADPISDTQIARSISALRRIGTQIHSLVRQTRTETTSKSSSLQIGVDLGLLIGSLIPGGSAITGILEGVSAHYTTTKIQSQAVAVEQLDKVAEYCEQAVDKHVERLKRGRNLGFWSTGIYFLAETETAVTTGTGILRAIYSGEESYLEPIRVHLFDRGSGVVESIKQFQHIPLPSPEAEEGTAGGSRDHWHPLGEMYEIVGTPLNTEELSIATSLPRRDVPGLRFVRNAVRFATNPPRLGADAEVVTLGRVMDTGVTLDMSYRFDLNNLVRHALVTGISGSGKSYTCRLLLGMVRQRGVPVLIIEPAKFEYVQWALEHNQKAAAADRFEIFMPGAKAMGGVALRSLELNPFEPASADGNNLDFATRRERFCTLLNASLPMQDVLPMLMEEAVYQYLERELGAGFEDRELAARESYPTLEGLGEVVREVILAHGSAADPRLQQGLLAGVQTRLRSLQRGKRGRVLNVPKSTPFVDLFERPVVVNLSLIADDRDKALIMSLLLTALLEYRTSKFRSDPKYRARADANKLCHLTVVEEAHRLLRIPDNAPSGLGNPQSVAATMFMDMLSEIRAYGQGLLIVDQIPSRLIPHWGCHQEHQLQVHPPAGGTR